ncbi:PLP-dependent aminotransferase family protein [Desulfospira joergensenii]|uniref:aminotransferase-like domain-containing protein n=1 Tax=Desulfospira joergensenii TaxID=53329 RepID=UPI0003B3BEE3|nr:PLP-dependent aminotransferase family protein [Desulfospira joergensenii]
MQQNLQKIEQRSRKHLYEAVAERIAYLIDQGTFKTSDKIPSLRKLSRQMKVSINTVKEAYNYLEDRRIIEARPQSGYYVCGCRCDIPKEQEIKTDLFNPTTISTSELAMQIMRDCSDPNLVQFGAAIPETGLLPIKKLNRMLSSEARRYQSESVNYSIPPGCLKLREQIAKRMLHCGCTLSPDEIVITNGGTEAIYLALKSVCKPGDILAIESPVYFNFMEIIQELDLKAIEIPSSPRDGISIDALKYALSQQRIQACLVISNFSNPLGGQIPDAKKEELVNLLAQHGIPLIEDDVHGDLSYNYDRSSVAKAYDKKNTVILCSSFSKTLSPGYRVGWVVPGKFQSRVEQLKLIYNIGSSIPAQLAIAEFLANGGYSHHLRSICRIYEKKVMMMRDAIGRFFPEGTCVTNPKGGFILWIQLPDSVDSRCLYWEAKKLGISISPGIIFSATGQFNNYIRLNAAFYSETNQWAVETLGKIISKFC